MRNFGLDCIGVGVVDVVAVVVSDDVVVSGRGVLLLFLF